MNYHQYILKVRTSPLLFSITPLHEYLSIANLGDTFHKTFLTQEEDSCTGQDPCKEPCQEYASSKEFVCVNPSRIKTFLNSHELSMNFTTYLGQFSIVHSTMYKHGLFYKLILSKQTHNVYVLFNMGYVLSEQQLYSSETDMMHLYLLLKSSGSNIVLCGHSMGAVQALRMALYLFEHDIDFFNTISVIVTGPYRWLRPHSKFTHLPNVHVYFSGYKDEIDAFASQNTLEHYVPYTVVTLEHMYMSDLQPSVFIKRDYAEPFHHLQFYRQLMGFTTIGGKRTKKYHNKRRKSKTNPIYKRRIH